jgi:hypothetical protein
MGSIFAKLRAGAISRVVLDMERSVDLESLSPEARVTYTGIHECLTNVNEAIASLHDYKDLREQMKVIMDTSRAAEHKEALEQSMDTIKQIQEFYHVAVEVSDKVPKLLNFIKSESLQDQEALCQVFTKLLDKLRQVCHQMCLLRRSG